MIAAGLGGRGASGHRGRSAFYDQQLRHGMLRLLELGGASCQSQTTTYNGRSFHFLESGRGRPLLLLHGAGGGAANWYRLIAPLSRSRRVLAPDLPGFGFSDPLRDAYPFGHSVADVIAGWLKELGIGSADVVGTSFGGLVAMRLAQRIDVGKVVLIDTVGLTRHLGIGLRVATAPFLARLAVSPTRRGTRLMLRHALTSGTLGAADEATLADYLYASARRTDVNELARAFTRFAAWSGQREILTRDELAALRGRLLVLWGERDRLLRAAPIARALALAGCSPARMISEAGHSPNWENPDAVLAAITEFLERSIS